VLYTSEHPGITLAEVTRSLASDAMLGTLARYVVTRIDVSLPAVADLTTFETLGLTLDDLGGDYFYAQAVGAEANRQGFDGLLVPSCTRLGTNLIIIAPMFPGDRRIRGVVVVPSSFAPKDR
jgi:RES domain-containing protein